MSAKKPETIYRRPKSGFEELDPENWEDLAICDAYDYAVNGKLPKNMDIRQQNSVLESKKKCLKKDLEASQNHKEVGDHSEQNVLWTRSTLSSSKKCNREINIVSNGKTQQTAQDWKIGDTCVALYYEDGLYYDCKIISTDETSRTCLVEYIGYGNKETIDMSDLHSPDKWEETMSSKSEINDNDFSSRQTGSYSSGPSSSSTEDTSSDVTQDLYKGRSGKKKKSDERKEPKRVGDHIRPSSDPFFAIPPPPPPYLMGQAFGYQSTYSSFPSNTQRHRNAPDISDDTLSSLLMSWYMAGYHTGYYQGINSSNSRKSKRK